jgi:hypothetical protein
MWEFADPTGPYAAPTTSPPAALDCVILESRRWAVPPFLRPGRPHWARRVLILAADETPNLIALDATAGKVYKHAVSELLAGFAKLVSHPGHCFLGEAGEPHSCPDRITFDYATDNPSAFYAVQLVHFLAFRRIASAPAWVARLGFPSPRIQSWIERGVTPQSAAARSVPSRLTCG